MLTFLFRRLYILLFLIWLGAAGVVFVFTLWGDLGTFLVDYRVIMEASTQPGNASSSDPVARLADLGISAEHDVEHIIRRKVIRDVLSVEAALEQKAHRGSSSEAAEVERLAKEREEFLRSRARPHEGVSELRGLTFTTTYDEVIAHLSTSKPVGKVTSFWMAHPTRLVVDLRGDWSNSTSASHRFEGSFIARVVTGGQPDRLRVVFNFTDTKAPQGGRPNLSPTAKGLDIAVANPAR